MKFKKTIYLGALITPMVLGIYFLLGSVSALAAGPNGHGPGGMEIRFQRGIGDHGMYGPHHGGFSWLGFLLVLIVGITVVVLLMKRLRKKANIVSMQQLIDTSIMSSPKPMKNHNASMLDQWENNIMNKKENV